MMGFSLYPMKTSTRLLWSTSFFRHKTIFILAFFF